MALVEACVPHEAVGHGGACLVSGGRAALFTSAYSWCSHNSPFIDAAGPTTKLVSAAIAAAAIRCKRVPATAVAFLARVLAFHGYVIDESLPAEAQRKGAKDPALIKRVHDAMARAVFNGASLVVCTCSTISGAAEQTPIKGRFFVARIDRAMADRAVRLGPRILLITALESTLASTAELLEESAATQNEPIEIQSLLSKMLGRTFCVRTKRPTQRPSSPQ